MKLQSLLVRLPDYLFCQVWGGPVDLQNMQALLQELRAATAADAGRRLLVDLTSVEGLPQFTDQFLLGHVVARELGHLERIASVVRPMERTGITGKIASLQGLPVQTFESGEAARTWLLDQETRAAPCAGGEFPAAA